MNQEQKRLLCDTEDVEEDRARNDGERIDRTIGCTCVNALHICTFLYAIIITVIFIFTKVEGTKHPVVPYSPITHIVEHEVQDVYPKTHSIYTGHPSEELDSAWAELVHPMLIQTSRSEVSLSNDSPEERLELVEGGYLSSLGVYHELHCLRRIYWKFYESHYFPNMTDRERHYERGHARHCIETIRRSLMCSANTALYTFKWDEKNEHSPQALTSNAKRQCVKWGPLHRWASERTVGLYPKYWRPGEKKEST
ncbi:hypothetical protein P154DRAFT_539246 [Amniculicola lignicola CBS 123094]|uniref:Uncharacterized protein n=1 Tax=Amniculicola lignicola CBS 123094 TaxID=1392246 RepID=A0A6A5WB79_9PLEO|nr:hypothetical protein P154DRAFT_539246 [Amniculicola lignicola CBS 123094]